MSSEVATSTIQIEKLLALSIKPTSFNGNIDKLYWKSTIEEFIVKCAKIRTDLLRRTPSKNEIESIILFWVNLLKKSKLIANRIPSCVIVLDIEYFQKLNAILLECNIDDIKNYIRYQIVCGIGSNVVHGIYRVMFPFFGELLQGRKKITQQRNIVINILSSTFIGENIGKMYVNKYFDNKSKEYIQNMIKMIKSEFRQTIKDLSWMSAITKSRALSKLSTFKTKIGYPDTWTNRLKSINSIMSHVKIDKNNDKYYIEPNELLSVIMKIWRDDFDFNVINSIDNMPRTDKWGINPHDVNAYYDPLNNEIVFPAGILQVPFFSKDNTDCQNYGMIGVIIGHEIIHGFDDQGRKYDHNGNLSEWWTSNDLEKFTAMATEVEKQYNQYTINDMNINGELTTSENIADIGGLKIALGGLRRLYLETQRTMTKEDICSFFESYATCWRNKVRKEHMLGMLLSDPHSPAKFRIYVVRNFDEFYEAYQDKSTLDTSKKNNQIKNLLYLPKNERLKIW